MSAKEAEPIGLRPAAVERDHLPDEHDVVGVAECLVCGDARELERELVPVAVLGLALRGALAEQERDEDRRAPQGQADSQRFRYVHGRSSEPVVTRQVR